MGSAAVVACVSRTGAVGGGDEITSYHVQAAIASVHAQAEDSASTDWKTILSLYDQLLDLAPSPVVALNRAVAVAKVGGPRQALSEIEFLSDDSLLKSYYLLPAVRGRLLRELGSFDAACDAYRQALTRPCSEPERKFLQRRLQECEERGRAG